MLVQMSTDQRDSRSAPPPAVDTFGRDLCQSSAIERLQAEQESCQADEIETFVEKQPLSGQSNTNQRERRDAAVSCLERLSSDDGQVRSEQHEEPEVSTNEHAASQQEQPRAQDSRSEPMVVTSTQKRPVASKRLDVRLLVRRREAGALIGKRGANIKRMRETYNGSTFNIPDTGNGPERVVCISANCWDSLEAILLEISQLFLDKNSVLHSSDEQVEMKQLINSAYAGSLIGMGGQAIRKLRNDSKAAIKIYEMCCPLSDERVCAIKARPPVVVSTIRLIHEMMLASQPTIKAPLQAHKLYDALNFDMNLVDKYGGYAPDDFGPKDLDHLRATGVGLSCLANRNDTIPFHNHRLPVPHAPAHMMHHFDPITGGEPLPVVMSRSGFRPAALFAPVQPVDFMPLHPLDTCTPHSQVNGHQLMPIDQAANGRALFNPRSNSFGNYHQQRTLSSASQTYRNQRFQPYSMSNGLQARLTYLQGQQTAQRNHERLMFESQLLIDHLSQQINQNVRPHLERNSRAAFNQRRASSGQTFNSSQNGASMPFVAAESSNRRQSDTRNSPSQPSPAACPCLPAKTSVSQSADQQISSHLNQSIDSEQSPPNAIDKQHLQPEDKSSRMAPTQKPTLGTTGRVASGTAMDQA